MAKYSFSVEVDSGLKPAGENDFPLAQAKDIAVDENGKRLSEKLPELELPKVTAADNGKVLSVVNGRWVAAEPPSGGMTIPVYDFAAMGMPPIVVGGEAVMLETDTTQLMQDLANGVVTFKVNFTLEDMTIPAVKTCGGFSSNEAGIATITGIDVAGDIMVQSVIMIQDGVIVAMAHLLDTMINAMIDAYMEDALGGDY